jgi:hypothetical protein
LGTAAEWLIKMPVGCGGLAVGQTR